MSPTLRTTIDPVGVSFMTVDACRSSVWLASGLACSTGSISLRLAVDGVGGLENFVVFLAGVFFVAVGRRELDASVAR